MTGQEIHGRIVSSPFRIIDIPGAGNPACGDLPHTKVSFQEIAHVIPISTVPFRPTAPGGKTAHLIESTRIPRLGDQLHIPQDRVKSQTLQKRRFTHRRTILVPPQDGGKIETKTVYMIGSRPVPQAFQDHLMHNGMVAVQGIAAATEIIVIPVRCQHIVNVIVKSFEGKAGSSLISLRRVIKYHIQNTLNAILMKGADQFFQFRSFFIIFHLRRVTGVGCKEAHRVVAPVIHHRFVVHHPVISHLVKLKDWHQLHCVDPQLF